MVSEIGAINGSHHGVLLFLNIRDQMRPNDIAQKAIPVRQVSGFSVNDRPVELASSTWSSRSAVVSPAKSGTLAVGVCSAISLRSPDGSVAAPDSHNAVSEKVSASISRLRMAFNDLNRSV